MHGPPEVSRELDAGDTLHIPAGACGHKAGEARCGIVVSKAHYGKSLASSPCNEQFRRQRAVGKGAVKVKVNEYHTFSAFIPFQEAVSPSPVRENHQSSS